MLNRKLRVLMLSLFAVMFAVSSAFAFLANDLTITLNDGSDTAKSFADYTGGVTVALPELSKENFDGYTITWSVSGDWTLTAEGAAPGEGAKSATATLKGTAPYTDSDKAYTFTITATFNPPPTEMKATIVKSADVTITVTAFDATDFKADTFSDDKYITYSPKNINEVGTDYSVTMTFATESEDGATVYPITFTSDDAMLDKSVSAGKYTFDVILFSTQGVSADAKLYVTVLSADFTVSYDVSVALARVNGTTLTDGTTYNVEFGVIPEGGTEEIRGSLGTLTGGSETILEVGSASSGCDAGLGMLVSALAAAFFIGRKRS